MIPKDILHELQQGGDISEDIKEFFRLKERRVSQVRRGMNVIGMGGYASTMAMSSFVPVPMPPPFGMPPPDMQGALPPY